MDYDIDNVARDMMLEPEELREILGIFLLETNQILTQCEQEYAAKNSAALAKLFHGLKGTALNLRLAYVGDLAAQLEQETKAGQMTNVGASLPQMKKEVLALQDLLKRHGDTSAV